MKILHCSDIHLGRRLVGASGEFSELRYNDYFIAFEYIIDYAVLHSIDVFVVAGDLFDKKEISPEILEKTEILFRKLKDANITTLVIEGNHDNIKFGKESESWINYLENKSLIIRPHYIEKNDEIDFNPLTIGNVRFYGLGYPGFYADAIIERLADNIVKTPDYLNYVIIHTALSNPDIMMGTIKHENILKLKGLADYIAGGHFHGYSFYPKDEPLFFVPGSPEMWDLNEFKQEKGFIIFDSETLEKKFFPVKNRDKQVINIKIVSSDLANANIEFIEKINSLELIDQAICYLFVELANQIEIDFEEAEKIILSKGAVKVLIKVSSGKTESINFTDFNSNLSEIEREVISSWEKFGNNADSTFSLLSNLKQFQLENIYDDFKSSLDNYLDTLITGEKNDN